MSTTYVPSRGDIVKMSFSPQSVGIVLADQLRSLDWRARRARFVEVAPASVVEEVLALIEPLVS